MTAKSQTNQVIAVLDVCLSVCLSVYQSVCLLVSVQGGTASDPYSVEVGYALID